MYVIDKGKADGMVLFELRENANGTDCGMSGYRQGWIFHE